MRRWAGGLLVVLALAGCGASSLSPGQLRASATELCNIGTRRMQAIPLPEAPSAGQRFLSQGIGALAPEVAGLRALRATGTFHDAVAATSGELAALRFALKGLRAGNDPVVVIKTLAQRLGGLEARANGIWHTLGISACISR